MIGTSRGTRSSGTSSRTVGASDTSSRTISDAGTSSRTISDDGNVTGGGTIDYRGGRSEPTRASEELALILNNLALNHLAPSADDDESSMLIPVPGKGGEAETKAGASRDAGGFSPGDCLDSDMDIVDSDASESAFGVPLCLSSMVSMGTLAPSEDSGSELGDSGGSCLSDGAPRRAGYGPLVPRRQQESTSGRTPAGGGGALASSRFSRRSVAISPRRSRRADTGDTDDDPIPAVRRRRRGSGVGAAPRVGAPPSSMWRGSSSGGGRRSHSNDSNNRIGSSRTGGTPLLDRPVGPRKSRNSATTTVEKWIAGPGTKPDGVVGKKMWKAEGQPNSEAVRRFSQLTRLCNPFANQTCVDVRSVKLSLSNAEIGRSRARSQSSLRKFVHRDCTPVPMKSYHLTLCP